jgi:hypothetical protein
MFEVEKIAQLAETEGVDVLAKVIFSFSPDIIMSPLALPKSILHPWVDEILDSLPESDRTIQLRDVLTQLKTRPTFQEQWPNEYAQALDKGKARVLQLEHIRKDQYTLADILREHKEVYDWYQSI